MSEQAAPADPGAITVLDTLPTAAPLVASGLQALSRTVVAARGAQAGAPAAELRALERLNNVAAAQYAEVRDTVSELAGFHAARGALSEALAPHLATLAEVEGVVAELEASARELDGQTRQLEALFGALGGS